MEERFEINIYFFNMVNFSCSVLICVYLLERTYTHTHTHTHIHTHTHTHTHTHKSHFCLHISVQIRVNTGRPCAHPLLSSFNPFHLFTIPCMPLYSPTIIHSISLMNHLLGVNASEEFKGTLMQT